jgi:hypothetical protein
MIKHSPNQEALVEIDPQTTAFTEPPKSSFSIQQALNIIWDKE